jgi:ferredoxin
MCRQRLAEGKVPACVEVCPREAVQFGKRADLLAEAKQRIQDHPERYYPKVYGETDGGGTQVLFLAGVPFEKLGLPNLGDEPVPELSMTVQESVYQGFTVPVALYGLLGAVLWRNRRSAEAASEEEKP